MKVFLAGHTGMVGGALLRRLQARGDRVVTQTHAQLDLTNQLAVRQFMRAERPDVVILAAAKVGGIKANDSFPADFIYENLMIEANVIHQAHDAGVQRLLFLANSGVYPKMAVQPMKEAALLSGRLEPTTEPQAIAKIAGIKMCESYNRQHGRDYRAVVSSNVYGPGDSFHPEHSHVLPGLILRFHDAVQAGREGVSVWGTGKPLREFLHVDDLAEAALFVLDLDRKVHAREVTAQQGHINIGSGSDLTVRDLAKVVAKVTGFTGRLMMDTTRPDGAPRRLTDASRLRRLGWEPRVPLEQGIRETYDWFLSRSEEMRRAG